MAAYWLYLRSDFFGVLTRAGDPRWVAWALAAAISCGVTVAPAIAGRAVNLVRDFGENRLLGVLGAAGTVGELLLRLVPAQGWLSFALLTLGVVLTVACVGGLTFAWASVAAEGDRWGLVAQGSGFALSFVLSSGALALTGTDDVLLVACPIVAGAAWGVARRDTRRRLVPREKGAGQPAVALLVLFTVVAGVVRGMGHAVLEVPGHGAPQRLFSIALAVLLVVALLFEARRQGTRALAGAWVLVALALLVGLLVLAYMGQEAYDVGTDIIVTSRVFLSFLLWLALSRSAGEQGTDARFGQWFCATEGVSWFLGYCGVPLWAAAVGADLTGYAGLMALGLLVVLIAGVLVSAAVPGFGQGQRTFADSESRREAACAAIASRHGLTPREAEVMELISRGHSLDRVAESLVVSTSTVQTHVKNLYRKTGLHSKQEVIDAVDAEASHVDGAR